ncbi:MAG: VWA domain-containing protein [Pyrinomonadaceae bacterium]|nr:VWA domain-containing protein [Pyrinomonadaceae bacterium]
MSSFVDPIPYAFTRGRTLLVSLVCALLLSISMATALQAQQQQPREAEESQGEPDEILRIDTDLVMVDTSVTDAEGRPVRGLSAKDFKLYEDNTERPIAFFNVERKFGAKRPIAVVFALDVSGSMTAEEIGRLRVAMQMFSARLSETTSSTFAIMTFGMRVKTLQSFTSDAQKLSRAFDRLEGEPSGLSTHTFDAVDDAVRLLVRSAPRTRERRLLKRAVIVITDGFPVGDTVSPRTVIERANSADVSVYTVTLPSFSRMIASSERQPLPTPLDVSGLAEKTGGLSVYATDKDFQPLFRALAEEVTSSYVLAFYPSDEKRRDGRQHTIRIEGPPGLTIRQSRPSYKYSDK